MSGEQELGLLREFMAREAAGLMRRYGAHSLGIGRLAPDDDQDDRLALLFYLDGEGSEPSPAAPVPPELEYLPEGRPEPVKVPTRVIQSAPLEFE